MKPENSWRWQPRIASLARTMVPTLLDVTSCMDGVQFLKLGGVAKPIGSF
jgi:hypothetical protein